MEDRYLCKAKRTDNDEWVIGGLVRYGFTGREKYYIVPSYASDLYALKIDPSTICWCTGLKDKNGKLIFENDILSGHIDVEFPEDETRKRVVWHENGWCTNEPGCDDYEELDDFDSENFEVIGNMIDNPELFIIQCNHGGERRPNDIREPMPTITGKHGYGIVEPYMVQIGQTGFTKDRSKDVREPLTTIVSKNEHCLIEPMLAPYMGTNTTNHPGGNCRDPIHTITTGNQQCLISPTLIQYHSETAKDEVRGQLIEEPIMTVDSSNRYGLVTSFLHKYYDGGYKGAGESMEKPLPTVTAWDHNSVVTANLIQMNNHCDGRDMRDPIPTITAGDGHFGEVRAFLVKYYGQGTGQDLKEPLDTIPTHDRFGLVTIKGVDYQIVDIGLRMLEPRELYGCQGFPDDYIIDHDYTGKTYPRSEQVRRCGNAVCPPIPAALVRANLPELCVAKRMPNMQIEAEQTGQLRFA